MRMLVGIVVLVGSLAVARAQPGPSVDDLVAKNLAAQGGEGKLRQRHSVRFVGNVTFGGGEQTIQASYLQVVKRPGKMRTEITLQGLTNVEGYDGKVGWSVSPFQGRRDVDKASGDQLVAYAQQADIDGPLLGWREKGHKLELLGTEDVDGTLAYKLRVTRKDGDVQYVFLDPDSYLTIRVTTHHKVRGTEEVSESDYGSYGQVNGVWMPFSIESGRPNGPRQAKLAITHAEINAPLDDSLFALPAKTAVAEISAAISDKTPPDVRPPADATARAPVFDAGIVSGLGARNIGSAAMSGRISAVAARVVNGRTLLYIGAASGGVWRSHDGGTTFTSMFDREKVQSIGAITIDPTNDKTVWVGTGEGWTRNSTSIGDGIYKSTDGGETWTNMGLPESERIVRIVVHPRNGNLVYACVPGKLWSDSNDRGVYRTTDGGKTWTKVLAGGNASTGCSSIAMDPRDPNVMFAGMWDFRRKGWTFRSGGEGPDATSASGMFRSSDGGKTWRPVTAKGLPATPWGRLDIAIAPSNSRIVYALIESKSSALYRSSDGGATWERRDASQMMVWRPFYFARLIVDPKDPDRLFKPDLNLIVSEDGGKSFASAAGGSHGDWHDLWIDPTNTSHIIGGDDGGLWLSYDGGTKWWKGNNLPISQFYHVSIDDKDPYHVYGGLQDNSSWVGDSSYPGGVTNQRWENVGGGDGFWTFVDPTDPDGIYYESQGGFISRTDRKTLASRDMQPKAGLHEKLRFNWNTPVHLSPTRNGTIYIGAQFLFRSRDRGMTWDRISPDLTTNDPAKQQQEQSGGVTVDNSSAEMHTTIYSISESPRDPNTIWVGTDDGNLQLTRDAGKTWTNVVGAVPGLAKNSWVSWVEASRYDPGTAYAAFDRHTFGDMTPWVFRTSDYGKTWTRIVSPDKGVRGYAHVIKEDTVSRSLLFLGTELGLWISIDGGTTWAEFKGNRFPSVAVRDLVIQPREGDLVIATHGRGIWIIDDLSPLRAMSVSTLASAAAFLPTRPIQQRMPAGGGWADGDATFTGDNATGAAQITYYLRTRHLYGPMKLEILDARGQVVDTLAGTKHRGINRAPWSMQVKPPRVPKAAQLAGAGLSGPRVVPGTYTVRLTRGKDVSETKLVIGVDRRASYTPADRAAQFDAAMKAHGVFGDMSKLVERIDAMRGAIDAREKVLAKDPLAATLDKIGDKLGELKKQIVATKEGGAITGEERLREHLDRAYGAILGWEGRPAKYQVDRVEVIRQELAETQRAVDALVAKEIKPLDEQLKAKKLEPISSAKLVPTLDQLAIRCVETKGLDCGPDHDAVAREQERD